MGSSRVTRNVRLQAGLLVMLASSVTAASNGQQPAISLVKTERPPADPASDSWWRGYMAAPQVRLADGRRLTLFCKGVGIPVVILDIGLGGGAWGWSTVQDQMAAKTRVCSYDRAGYSDSDPAKTPRTFDALEADLDGLLRNAKLPGPYVLVGQSLGGAIVGLYAQRHPEKVAGLVLVDPATGNQDARFKAVAPESDQTASRMAAARRCARAADEGTLLPGSAVEQECIPPDRPGFEPPAFASARYRKWQRGSNLRARLAEMEGLDYATLHWPSVTRTKAPVLVLTRSFTAAGQPKEHELWELWNAMHQEIADKSSDGLNCIIPRSTHSMMSSRPDVVIRAVYRMVDAVRGRRSIGSTCGYAD